MSFAKGTVPMESMKDDKQSKISAVFPASTLGVAERRFTWLQKQHPKMSRYARQLWAFGDHSSPGNVEKH
jgi:hypothetical protein